MLKAAAVRGLLFISLCASMILLSSCTEQSDVTLPVLEDYDQKREHKGKDSLKLGVVTGPYGDMFMDIVEPLLAEKGYNIEIVTYNNYIDPNFALANGDIDINIFQHYKYLNKFKFEFNLELSAISEVPTALMGIYSHKFSSLADLTEGSAVAIPNDSTNLSRALVVLSSTGLITVDPNADNAKLTLNDIFGNFKKLNFVPLEAHLLCDALHKYDMAIINGNFAINGGLKLSDSLFNEKLTSHEYINIVAVRTKDLGEKFVMDLLFVLRSKEYVNAITEVGGKYSNFQYPCNFRAFLR